MGAEGVGRFLESGFPQLSHFPSELFEAPLDVQHIGNLDSVFTSKSGEDANQAIEITGYIRAVPVVPLRTSSQTCFDG